MQVQKPLDIQVHQSEDGPVVRLAGDLCTTTVGLLQETVSACLAQDPPMIRFDLRNVYLDSLGLATLINIVKQCWRTTTNVELVSPPATREVLTRLGFPPNFRLEPNAMVRVLRHHDV